MTSICSFIAFLCSKAFCESIPVVLYCTYCTICTSTTSLLVQERKEETTLWRGGRVSFCGGGGLIVSLATFGNSNSPSSFADGGRLHHPHHPGLLRRRDGAQSDPTQDQGRLRAERGRRQDCPRRPRLHLQDTQQDGKDGHRGRSEEGMDLPL